MIIQNLCFNWIIAIICSISPITVPNYLPKPLLWLCYSPGQKISNGSLLSKLFTLAFKIFQFDSQFTPTTLFLLLFCIYYFISARLATYCCSDMMSFFTRFLCCQLPLGYSSHFTCLKSSILFKTQCKLLWSFLRLPKVDFVSFFRTF